MTVTLNDILLALCSRVQPLNENDSQLIFSLATPREAQLAHDVLSAHGFDTRVYHESGLSKLYISKSGDVWNDDAAFKDAFAYAKTAKRILFGMHEYADESFHIRFEKNPDSGKQISIHFPPGKLAEDRPLPPRPMPLQTLSAKPIPPRGRLKKRKLDPEKDMIMGTTASELSKQSLFGDNTDALQAPIEPTFGKRLSVYFFGSLTEGFYAFVGGALVALILAGGISIARGIICADIPLVHEKAWYCPAPRNILNP